MRIREVIVVEGRDDITAVKRAVDAEVIATGGFGFPADLFQRLKSAQERKGLIVLTDPDQPGNWIRRQITEQVPEAKHAFIEKRLAQNAQGDVGVEYATPETIRHALENARAVLEAPEDLFTMEDLILCDLTGGQKASTRRGWLGNWLGIGFGNAKQFLQRLNRFGVSREEWVEALEALEREEQSDAID